MPLRSSGPGAEFSRSARRASVPVLDTSPDLPRCRILGPEVRRDEAPGLVTRDASRRGFERAAGEAGVRSRLDLRTARRRCVDLRIPQTHLGRATAVVGADTGAVDSPDHVEKRVAETTVSVMLTVIEGGGRATSSTEPLQSLSRPSHASSPLFVVLQMRKSAPSSRAVVLIPSVTSTRPS